VKKRSVRVRILKAYRSKDVNFARGEIVWVTQKFADELILADAAEYPEEQIDIEIERITRENPRAIANLNAYIEGELAAGRTEPTDFPFVEKQDPTFAGLNIGDKVRATRDFLVEPFFDEGWEVKKGMIGFVYALDQDDGEIAVDFNEALGGGTEKGDIVLVVPLDAIEPISD
jgi:ATP-dependent exoDNAse (exonuclease V) alpha subunit